MTGSVGERFLHQVERTALLLALAVSAGSLLFVRLDVALGASVGAALAALNLAALRRLAVRFPRLAARGRALVSLLLVAKMAALIVAVYLLMRLLPMHVGAFLVGLSVPFTAILVSALRAQAAESHG